ncbi:MAG: hypothetical protein ACKODN_04760 [Actinomycetota bacterium]
MRARDDHLLVGHGGEQPREQCLGAASVERGKHIVEHHDRWCAVPFGNGLVRGHA